MNNYLNFWFNVHFLGIVSKNDTLFTYRGGKDYDDYVDPGFTPVFLEDVESIFSNSNLQKEIKRICGDNIQCTFDIAVSGKTNIGQVTLNSINNLKERKRNLLISKFRYLKCPWVLPAPTPPPPPPPTILNLLNLMFFVSQKILIEGCCSNQSYFLIPTVYTTSSLHLS